MSARHIPEHELGACGRCDRRRIRVAAYLERLEARSRPSEPAPARKALYGLADLFRAVLFGQGRIARSDLELAPRRKRQANRERMERRARRRARAPKAAAV